jgi:multidrug transporter EmrE-like cation transporter
MAKTVKPIADILRLHEYSGLVVERFIESRWFSIGLILSNSVLSTCAEVLLKIGATHPSAIAFPAPIAFISAIFSYWVLLGIFAYIASLSLWLTALPRLPLHLAYGLSSTVHLLVPFACWLVLHESIPKGRLLGMAFILAGTLTLGFSHEQSLQDD